MRLKHHAALALAGFGGLVSCRAIPPTSARAQPADLVVYGRVWTGDSTIPWAGGVAVSGDTIAEVGDSSRLARWVGNATTVINNGRAMVIPGFMDGHTHFLAGGTQLANIELRNASSPAELVALIKARVAKAQPGEWILGGNWDHERWPGAALPERSWVDSVTPDNPIFLSRLDGHMALANSRALRAAGVTAQTRDVVGGTIVRDRSGEPTGIFKDEATNLIARVIPAPSTEQDDSALVRAMRHAAEKGVTAVVSVYDGAGGRSPWYEYAALRRLHASGRVTTRVAEYGDLADWRAIADTIRVRGSGDAMVRLMGVKGFVDGSLGSTTALFYQPYNDEPGTSGLLVTPAESLRAWIGGADSAGLHVVVHAIGERANGLLLEIYDSVARAHGARDRRFRIEHAQHLRRGDIARLARSGVIASMQPYHAIDDGRWAEKRIGPARIKTTYAFRSLLDSGAHLAFGSDWTVAPLDPILGIYAAVARRTLDGKHPNGWIPAEKITVEEALVAYTAGNAYGVFADSTRGKLKPGYLADLVLLDQDLTAIAPEAIERVKIRGTVVGGKVVFQRP